MAIPEHEQLYRLAEARKFMPSVGGRHPSIPSVWRWCRKGIQGVRLEYVRVGRAIATSREAVHRFYNALAEADKVLTQPPMVALNHLKPASASAEAASKALSRRILGEAGIWPTEEPAEGSTP